MKSAFIVCAFTALMQKASATEHDAALIKEEIGK